MKEYFHEAFNQESLELAKKQTPKITWNEIMEKYKQPKWCDYPDALSGYMGCWSLVGGKVTGKDYCKGCDLFND